MADFLYSAEGININDSWYLRCQDRIWAYYLQYPADGPEEGRWTRQSIGLSVSADFVNWEYMGTVLAPQTGAWDYSGLATGSTVVKDGLVHLLYTGNGDPAADGLGLAVGETPDRLERAGNGPVISRAHPFLFPYQGATLRCRVLADPYIVPESVDGWYYVFINCHAIDRPIGQRGCIAVMRSRDLMHYEPFSIALLSDDHDRLETPQAWRQDGRWMLYFGAVRSRAGEDGRAVDIGMDNRVYVSDTLTGGYEPVDGSLLALPDGQPFYIGKSVETADGARRFLVNVYPQGGYGPYTLTYSDGRISICE